MKTQLHHCRILVCDDDFLVRESLKDALEFEGYEVITAEGGNHCLDMLYTSGPARLLVLDLQMPVVDGWRVLERLAEFPRKLQPRHVIVVSGVANLTSLERRYGCTVLSKPVDLPRLLAVIERHCGLDHPGGQPCPPGR